MGLLPNPPHDLRQVRTRSALVSSLLELLEEKPFRSLSVVDICQRATVHRTTFYAHFKDRESLLEYALITLTQRFFQTSMTEPDFLDALFHSGRCALDFIQTRHRLYAVGLREEAGTVANVLEEAFAGLMCQRLEHPELRDCIAPLDPTICYHFLAGGAVSIVHWWLEQEFPVPAETILDHIRSLLPAALTRKDEPSHV